MSRKKFDLAFPLGKAFLPVIHVHNAMQAVRNAKVAVENGADGVFLIGHGLPYTEVCAAYIAVKAVYPDFWVGVNFLDLASPEAQGTVIDWGFNHGLWTDDGGISSQGSDLDQVKLDRAKRLVEMREQDNWPGLHFGGVAFKGQFERGDPAWLAMKAVPYMDVITTSGRATGEPPALDKIKAMRRVINDHPFAIASGMTPKNIEPYVPFTDAFLIATGISDGDDELVPSLTRETGQLIHA